MTLVLGAIANLHVFHASDRLITVTSRTKSIPKAWDIASNKTVIAIGQNCWLVIGYTGLAYLDGKPTDQFIAEAITGVSDLSGAGVSGWRPPIGEMHYRAITTRIGEAMRAAYQRLEPAQRGYTTTVLGVGLQQASADSIRNCMFELNVTDSDVLLEELAERHPASDRVGMDAVGSVDPMVHARLREVITHHGGESPTHFRRAMVEAVQQTGQRSDLVGEDVLSVELQPTNGKILVEFTKSPSTAAIPVPIPSGLDDTNDWTDQPRVYTPYVIVPGMIMHPAVASPGTWKLGRDSSSSPDIEYTISGNDLDPEPGRAFYSSHPRKSPP